MTDSTRILFIEDNPGDARLAREELSEAGDGFRLIRVDRLDAGLAHLAVEPVDAVLLDLSLPDSTGLETLEQVLKAAPAVPVIVMTGTADEDTAVRAVQAGAQDYLIKGQAAGLLRHAIRYAIERKRSEERFRQVVESSPNAILLVDPEGRIVMVNSRTQETFGYEREELIGMQIDRLVPERMRANHSAHRAAYLAELEPRKMGQGRDLYGLRKDGGEFPVEIGLTPVETEEAPLAMATVIDITERMQTEERIRYQAQILESVSDVIVATDLEGRVRSWNRAAELIFGYSEAEVLGRPAEEVVRTDYMTESREAVFDSLRKTGVWEGEVRVRGRDGITYHTLASASAIHDPAGRPIGYLSINHDISQRKQAEEDLQQRLAELEAVARTAAALRSVVTRAELLPVIQEEVQAILGAEAVAFILRDPAGNGAVVETAIGAYAAAIGDRIPPGQGVTWEAIATGRPYVSNDWQNDTRLSHPHIHSGLEGIACTPLIESDSTLGVLWMGRTTPIENDDLRLLNAIADMAATAIHRANLLEQTRRQVSRLGALRELDLAIMSSFDLRLTLNVLLRQVMTHLEVDAAVVLLLDSHSHQLEAEAWKGFQGSGPDGFRLRLGEGYGGRAALERRIVRVPNLTPDDPKLSRTDMVRQEGFVSMIALPLIAKGEVQGVLEILHRTPLPEDSEWLDFLEMLAGQAAIAIDDARLYGDLHQSNLELTLAYDTTIEGWSRALDLRDRETEGHTQRVTELTLTLARKMGVGESNLVHIRRGALLHDIGKMGVPDQILHKPGPLDDDEWEIMRRHPVNALELLSPIAYLRPALDIPYCHHEKWDGTGYPRGLRGEEIPLAARIFAVVDVWDALRSDRPYRDAWSYDKALEYIESEIGGHFDPRVVEQFLEILDEEGR